MWADVETKNDFLNFKVMAGLVAQMVLDAGGKPLSIGISGGWGVGKSSMIKLIEEELQTANERRIITLTFNPWLYQGQDDAKAALMEEISRVLMGCAKENQPLLKMVRDLAARVNWFRVLRMGGEIGASLVTGFPVGALVKGTTALYEHFADGEVSGADVGEGHQFLQEQALEARTLLAPKKKPETPPQLIHAIRAQFEEILKELNITLVVFVDDLDRCLPPTVIGTLEAMRLFLFMERTAFVIAADDKMIKESVRIHFQGANLDDDLVVNYFDKLIQVPLRVPPLGVNEVRAYLMLLFVGGTRDLEESAKEGIRKKVRARLAESWKGESVSARFVTELIPNCPKPLQVELALADRLAKQMASSRRIAGNPRLIKRFLNTLSIRKKLADLQGITVDVPVLAKVLLFERCAAPASFDFFVQAVNRAQFGKPECLVLAERLAKTDEGFPTEGFEVWSADKAFVTEWMRLDPPLGEVDLRGALHVGRETLPLLSEQDRVSIEAQDVLKDLLALRMRCPEDLSSRLGRLLPDERAFVMDKLLQRASTESEWGTPDILWSLMAAATADSDLAKRLVVFLAGRSSESLKPQIVLRIADQDWAKEVLGEWHDRADLSKPMKTMVSKRMGGR